MLSEPLTPPTIAASRAPSRRAGFSLIEALVVLMIAGLALSLVFAIGVRATSQGLRLGQRALDVADRTIGAKALRTAVRGLVLAPRDAPLATGTVFEGRADGFSGQAVLSDAIPCAAAGPVSRLRVFIEHRTDGDRVACQVDRGEAVTLLMLTGRRAYFAYSADGQGWSDRWTPPRPFGATRPVPRAQNLDIRLVTDAAGLQLIERAASGRPALWGLSTAAAPR